MKKYLYLLLIICLFPIQILALDTQEEVIQVINKIENTVVDENIKITHVKMQDTTIEVQLEGSDSRLVSIPYQWRDNKLYFGSGRVIMMGENPTIPIIENNIESFYLYSILENLSNSPYDMDNYYDEVQLEKKIQSSMTYQIPFHYTDISETFGCVLEETETPGTYNLWYTYNLNSDYTLNKDKQESVLEPIPTAAGVGGYLIVITVMLGCVICLAIYSLMDNVKRRRKDEKKK